ncbi:hypothetical protein [Vallitalea sp.]|jgi:hypothetical protein|uniref:hypothetical protein n=1 Tax=Vallitalea sp. TaxID=1882829 RepID=UPI0025FC5B6A|nr:hypothetical protein [Vallitalea sp.]MCT4686609.1 hypothetical protein [Vallitalea sp.]
MDHVLNGMRSYYEVYRDLFIEEHRNNNYKKFSDNPYYDEVKALIDSMNILRKYLGWDNITLKQELEYCL